MSKKDIEVSISLPPGTDELEAHNALVKALLHHSSGDVHSKESFEDPAMIDIQHHMVDIHKKIYAEMIDEIISALEEEYE